MTNRGPLRLGRDGRPHPDILEEYNRAGFYVLEGAVARAEVGEMRAEFEELIANAPVEGEIHRVDPKCKLTQQFD